SPIARRTVTESCSYALGSRLTRKFQCDDKLPWMIRRGIDLPLSVPAASFLIGKFPIDRGVVRPGKAHCYGSLCVRRVRSNLVVKKIGDRFDRVWFRYQRFDFPVIQISSGRDYLSLHVL